MAYRCTTCGKVHDDLPHPGADKPDPWWNVPEHEREGRIYLTADVCVIDDVQFFIRGVIEIPVHDYPEPFAFGAWVSQKRENFQTYLENWTSKDIGPFFGWLSTRIAFYEEDTFLLKTMAYFRGEKLRPFIELEPTEHPLAIDQRNGITLEKAWDIVHWCERTMRF